MINPQRCFAWLRRGGALIAVAAAGATAFGATPPTGQWDFENGDLAATVGSALTYVDGPGGATEQGTAFGTTTSFGIPNIAGTAAKVMKFPANAPGMGLSMPAPADANGGGTLVNNYTLIMDLLFPPESMNIYRALLDTDLGAINADSEFAVGQNNGIGINGRYDGALLTNTWHRVAMVVSDGTIYKYIDGALVGSQTTDSLDGRFALAPGGSASLFADDNSETGVGYVNSIQLWPEALTRGQLAALGAPTAAGIPSTLPPAPSYVEKFIPRSAYGTLTNDVGVILVLGDATIADSSISATLDGTALTGLTFTRADGKLTIRKTGLPAFSPGTSHTLVVNYTDSILGAKTATHTFTSALFFEDFEDLVLGHSVEEDVPASGVWTKTAPDGWIPDDSQMPGITDPSTDGKTEWAGFSFANKDWWALTAGGQDRENFNSATGTVMIADPDEWDDAAHDHGMYTSFITTPDISLTGVPAASAFVKFLSSWKPECCDDAADLDNSQTATIEVSYDDGAFGEVFKYDSTVGSPTYHGDDVNQTVIVRLTNPAGAKKMALRFGMTRAENDWFWAVDDVLVQAGAEPPVISQQPITQYASQGANVTLKVTAAGTAPITYKWQKDGVDVPGATGAELTLNSVTAAKSGAYTVIVSNPGGSVTSQPARLEVVTATSITQDLVAHLKFDDNLDDSSGHNNGGTAIGAPTFSTGKVGTSAMHIGTTDDFVSLGAPTDLNFGSDTDFTISFWTKVTAWSGDASFIANKDWDSGSNVGYVLSTDDDGRLQWNWAGKLDGSNGDRKDYDGPAGTFSDHAWHNIVMAVDRQGYVVTYVDGVPRDGRNISTPPNKLDTLDGYATNIGQDGAGDYGSRFSDADFDDVGIWRRVLSAQEVANIFSKGQEGKDLTTASFKAGLTTPIEQDLVVYLPFENSLRDDSGKGNNGSAVQTIGYTAGKVGTGSLHIGQTAGYVTLGTPADLNFGADTDFTVAFWAKVTAWADDPSFIANKDWDSGSNVGWVIATDSDGHLQWNMAGNADGSNGSRKDYDGPAGLFSDHAWHHVLVSYDRQGNAVTFVDGAQVDSRAISTPPNTVTTKAGLATNIGQDGAGDYGPVFTDIDMDEVAIWRRALTAEDAAALFGATGGLWSLATTPPPPSITSVTVNGANLVINVSRASATAKLQRRDTFSPTASWQDVGPITGGSITVPITGTMGFFRVVNP
jgi:hypothetical protein